MKYSKKSGSGNMKIYTMEHGKNKSENNKAGCLYAIRKLGENDDGIRLSN